MKSNVNSNYQIIDSLVIDQTGENIGLINFKNRTKSIFFDKNFTNKLNKIQKYIYLIKG